MLFVSRVTHYQFTVRSTVDLITSNNTGIPVRSGLTIEFRPGGIPEWARQQAAATFGHQPGVAHDEDPTWRYSMFDTDAEAHMRGWDSETKALVDERLLTGLGYGDDHILVEKPKLPAPWPNYDKLVPRGKRTADMVAQLIADKVRDDGYDADTVVAYESENLNRSEVINAIRQAAARDEEPKEELIEA